MRAFAAIAICLSLAAGASFRLLGQALGGSLTGRITDATGSGIPRARVQVTHMDTSVAASVEADSTGQYRLNQLAAGRYRIEASADGFQAAARQNLEIAANRTETLNLVLAVGPMQLTVEIADAGVTIDTTSARVQTGFGERQMSQLPVTGLGSLGVLNLSLLSAGVSSSGGMGYGTGPSVGGQRPTNNNFTIDGVDNNDRNVTGPVLLPSNEAILEMVVQQNQYSPEFGHSSGGQFNLITKSGTNGFRGSGYLYHQNRSLNAIDQSFARQGLREKPRFDQNRFGGTAGGAVIRNRLFYFGNAESRPLGQASVTSGGVYAPTAEGLRILDSLGGLSRTNLEQFKRWVPAAPVATRSVKVSNQNIPVGLIQTQGPSYENFRNGLGSLDWIVSERDQLHGRYLAHHVNGPMTDALLPAFFTPYFNRAQLASLTHHHLFRPNVTNELRFGYQRRDDDYPGTTVSYPGLDAFPNIMLDDLGLDLGPFSSLPQAARSNTFQVTENLIWVRGRSTWKFGYDGRKLNSSTYFTQRVRGVYQYQSLERFLLDLSPEQADRSAGGSPFAGNLLSHYWYANNDWRLRSNITVNLGLRYEYVGVPAGARLQKVNALASVPGLIDFREPRATKGDFTPRVGIAWAPGRSGRTSVRAGFGMNYDQIYQNLGVTTLPPQFFTSVSIDSTQAPTTGFLAKGGIPPDTMPLPLTAAQARAATAAFVPDQVRPYSIQWNAGVQRVFRRDYTFELRYLGNRGVHLPYQVRINRMAAVTTPERSLPLFFERPSAAQLDALKLTRDDLKAPAHPLQEAGFYNNVTAFLPVGNSTYHGLATQLNKRFSQGFLLTTAYTWSHAIDDSTATLNSTVLSPRRPQDFFDLRRERGSSALDHRHRFTQSWYWETPWFKQHPNPFLRALLSEWLLSGAYMAETGSWATARSGFDSNLNGDAAGDRTFVNPLGDKRTASAVTPLCKSAITPIDCTSKKPPKSLVGYLVVNPGARYIQGGEGMFTNSGRNTFRLPMINNFDLAAGKRVRLGEKKALEFRGEAYNALNHAQYTAGFPSIANSRARVSVADTLLMQAASPTFGRADQAFQSNARMMQLVARFTF